MRTWVFCRGLENGYVIMTRRSKKAGDQVKKVWIKCDRGGEHNTTATVRRAGSKKINCPFEVVGVYNKLRGVWTVQVVGDRHNHKPYKFSEGHPFVRRLTPDEYRKVEEMHELNMKPRDILMALKKQFEGNKSVRKDINNAVHKIRMESKIGETPIQTLEHLLYSKQFVYHTREDPLTNVVQDIFFIHPVSLKIWRAFPHVLLIDATYKTNNYHMPFLQVVGVTSTGKSFCVASAFVSNEREETFLWVLDMLKSTLENSMEPRAIITDRDLALINACAKTFSNSTRSLCRFHIQQNIYKNCRKAFKEKDDWGRFLHYWRTLCQSPTPELYDYNYDVLYQLLQNPAQNCKCYLINVIILLADIKICFSVVIEYVNKNWLNEYKENFVSCWTNKYLNFRETTTNRVEGMHASLKACLYSYNNTLNQLVGYFDTIVQSQEIEIKKSFEESQIKIMNDHRIPLFDNLRGQVSHKALDLLIAELNKLEYLQNIGTSCDDQLKTSCGLPCACMLAHYIQTGNFVITKNFECC